MKIAVYDRFWATGGGGETFAAGIAAALAGEHEVDLLAHEPVDRGWLGERLRLDLSGLGVAEVPDHAGAVTRASAGYDVLVNASYRSGDPSRARVGSIYVVHFPGSLPDAAERARQWMSARGTRLLAGPEAATVTFAEGFYLPEPSRLHSMRWTAGDATLVVSSQAGGRVPVVVLLGRFLPPQVAPREVAAEVDGETLGKAVVTAPASRLDRRRAAALRFTLDLAPGRPQRVVLRCPAWVPADEGIGTDRRRLGVPVVGAHAGDGWRGAVAAGVPVLVGPGAGLDFLDTYDRVLTNSEFTRRWTERLWGRADGVLYPPVPGVGVSAPPGAEGAATGGPGTGDPKEPLILSVGRFFLPGTGHNKKQLEMVRAFRRLHEEGGAAAWTYHLVGGCAPEHAAYLDQIRDEARGLPVVLHPDASGAELAALYRRASIFWHAAGLGEDPERRPDRFEHFGITTVEAMAAGAVPVVIDAGGQAEIVAPGRSGYRFVDEDGLVARTRHLIADEGLRARLSAGAREASQRFAWDHFAERVRREVDALPAR